MFLHVPLSVLLAASPAVTPLGQPRPVHKWTGPASRFRLTLLVLLNGAAAGCVRARAKWPLLLPFSNSIGRKRLLIGSGRLHGNARRSITVLAGGTACPPGRAPVCLHGANAANRIE